MYFIGVYNKNRITTCSMTATSTLAHIPWFPYHWMSLDPSPLFLQATADISHI